MQTDPAKERLQAASPRVVAMRGAMVNGKVRAARHDILSADEQTSAETSGASDPPPRTPLMSAQPHVIESLPILTLFPHSRCNCRCVMCDIWKITSAEEISAGDVESHLQDIEALGVRWVVFSGGEPLMHSDLFRLARLLGSRGIRTTILTTGLLVRRDATRIVESIDDVIVSLDGPPEIHDRVQRVRGGFEKLEAGVDALRELDPSFPITARATVQRLNHAYLGQTVDTARALGLGAVSFLAADVTSGAFNRSGGWPAERQAEVALSEEQIDRLEWKSRG